MSASASGSSIDSLSLGPFGVNHNDSIELRYTEIPSGWQLLTYEESNIGDFVFDLNYSPPGTFVTEPPASLTILGFQGGTSGNYTPIWETI